VGRAITEKLAERLLVVGDVMLLDECNKIRGRVAGQRRFPKMRIRRDEVFGSAVNVGEVTASAAGYQDFLSCAFSALDDGHAASPLARFQSAHQAGGTCAEDDCVKLLRHWVCGAIRAGDD